MEKMMDYALLTEKLKSLLEKYAPGRNFQVEARAANIGSRQLHKFLKTKDSVLFLSSKNYIDLLAYVDSSHVTYVLSTGVYRLETDAISNYDKSDHNHWFFRVAKDRDAIVLETFSGPLPSLEWCVGKLFEYIL